jgi:hypothetical protein
MKREATSFGGLVRAEARERLQRRNFPGPAARVAPVPSSRRLLFGAALVATIGALSVPQGHGAVNPEPDPYPSRPSAPAPTPDPYASGTRSAPKIQPEPDRVATSSAPRVQRAPEPTTAPTPVSTPRVTAENESATARSSTEQRRTTPAIRRPDTRANRPVTKKQARTAPPRATPKKAPKKTTTTVAAPAAAGAAASTNARPLALAGLALFALVLASSSLLYIAARNDGWGARAR